MKSLILASTSTIYGSGYLEYILPKLTQHFIDCDEIIFIPYARPSGISHDDYTAKVASAFKQINIDVRGVHEFSNPKEAILNAKGIFTGGGNTFLLVNQLYKLDLIEPLKFAVENGCPYFGTSAGSNIAGISMKTTNDMPIIHSPSFDTLGLVPFNLNPHYIESDGGNEHMGETRETRINEFHTINNTPVIGLREGSWIEVNGDAIYLRGSLHAKIFKKDQKALEVESNTDLNFILK